MQSGVFKRKVNLSALLLPWHLLLCRVLTPVCEHGQISEISRKYVPIFCYTVCFFIDFFFIKSLFIIYIWCTPAFCILKSFCIVNIFLSCLHFFNIHIINYELSHKSLLKSWRNWFIISLKSLNEQLVQYALFLGKLNASGTTQSSSLEQVKNQVKLSEYLGHNLSVFFVHSWHITSGYASMLTPTCYNMT